MLLFSVDLLYSVNPVIIIIYKILHGNRIGMASLRLEPPASFPFSRPDKWPQWKLRFEQF